MGATVPHVTSGLGLRKFQADGFLLTRVCHLQREGFFKPVAILKLLCMRFFCFDNLYCFNFYN